MRIRSRGRLSVSLVVGACLAETACLGGSLLASSRSTTHIESIPPGAQVFVMGERLGITPLDVEDQRVFPIDYPRSKADLYGKIVLRKESCLDLVQPLSMRAANHGMIAELRCFPNTKERDASPVEPVHEGGSDSRLAEPTGRASSSLDERLSEIEVLRQQGLISEEELHVQRERVLKEVLTTESATDALLEMDALRAAGSIEESEFQRLRKIILEGL